MRKDSRPLFSSPETAVIIAVADTNIYLSALLFGGSCEAILGLARAGLLDLYDSPAIERELRRVLHEKFHWTAPFSSGRLLC